MNSLIIKKEHLDKILDGRKKWEIRGSNCKIRGKIGLIESGSGTIVGTCEIVDSFPLSEDEYILNENKHRNNRKTLPYKNTHAWVISNAKRIKPIKYTHPKGAIIWVKTR